MLSALESLVGKERYAIEVLVLLLLFIFSASHFNLIKVIFLLIFLLYTSILKCHGKIIFPTSYVVTNSRKISH